MFLSFPRNIMTPLTPPNKPPINTLDENDAQNDADSEMHINPRVSLIVQNDAAKGNIRQMLMLWAQVIIVP